MKSRLGTIHVHIHRCNHTSVGDKKVGSFDELHIGRSNIISISPVGKDLARRSLYLAMIL